MARKFHAKSKRPVWSGPETDCYYYVVKNKPKGSSAWIVLYSDVRDDIRLIANIQGGHRSLVETDRPLSLSPNEGKLLAHGKVEQVKQALWESMDRKLTLLGPEGERVPVKGREVTDEEIFI